jgi:SAM-dependent methyltransferase
VSKQNEKTYYSRLTEDGKRHAAGKPYTDPECGQLLMTVGQIVTLLPSPPARVLDLGCGTGWTSECYARAGYRVTGLDISADMVAVAARLRTAPGLSFVVGDFEQVPHSAAFDAVVSYGAVHHAEDLPATLSACRMALKPGGVLVLMEPGEGHAESDTTRRCAAQFGISERGLPPALLCSTLRSAGFREVEVIPWLGLASSELGAPLERRGWKYRLSARLLGTRLADCLQLHSRTGKCAVVRAHA